MLMRPAFLMYANCLFAHSMACDTLPGTTFMLVTMIFLLTEGCNVGRPSEGASPIFIGGTVAALIAVSAPLTQTGINPARDFGPRLISYLAGWGQIAIPGPKGGFFWVYIAAPLFGGAVAAACFRFVIAPLMASKGTEDVCTCKPVITGEIFPD